MTRILAACGEYGHKYESAGKAYLRQLYALVLLMRHSGSRIRDAVTLHRDMVKDQKLFLFTAKTGTPVSCPLPEIVIKALSRAERPNGYFFRSGEGKPKSAVGDWQRKLKRVFELAGVRGRHAHRMRDTFAVELLLSGTPLEVVSMLLGHQSIRVTEKHYSPWVRSRQEQLEASIMRSWNVGAYHTPQTHAKEEVSNPVKIQ